MKTMLLRLLAPLLAVLLGSGCAALRETVPAPARAPASAASAAPAAAAAANALPPFAVPIKGAHRIDGPLVAWQKDEKVWLELRPQDLGRPFLFTPKVSQGIAEGLLLGGLMLYPSAGAGGAQVVEFVRVHNTIRLQARNTDVSAAEGTAEARAVRSAYSASLLGAAPVASQPHPDRQSILIDATGMLLNDMAGIGLQLQRQFRQGYSPDPRNSVITAVRGDAQSLVVQTQTHWFSGGIAAGVPTPAMQAAGVQPPAVPRWLPDSRSLLIGLHLSFVALPEALMAPRRADPRVGLFSTRVLDFADELARSPIRRHITRWRLEKKDPAAALSAPVKPIVFRIDRSVPEVYRATVRDAILEWNKAFLRIGLQDALVVEQQAADARYDTLDPGFVGVRWLLNAEPAISAIGQTQIDPRSGEILDADVALEGLFTRAQRWMRGQLLASRPLPSQVASAAGLPWLLGRPAAGDASCHHAASLAEQALYALDLLDARTDLAPDSAEVQQFVLDYVRDTVMHEVGHTLGLRHNFRASRVYTEAELADPDFTRAHGTGGSVMEYAALNLAAPGQPGGSLFQSTLGPYDYWAIEYAYKPLPEGTGPADEEAHVRAVAARSSEPLLAYGSDDDAQLGVDAETIQFDLGADPVAFARKRLAIAHDLFRRQETRELPPDADYSVLRRTLHHALADSTRAVGVLMRQLGGLRTLRDFPGSGREPLQPVAVEQQRQALQGIVAALLEPQGFAVSPALARRLAPDYLERGEPPGAPVDYNVAQRLLDLQRAVLAYLLGEPFATRLLDANDKLDVGAPRLTPAEVYRQLGHALWLELDAGGAIPPARRELQREHVNRLALAALRPAAGMRVDARAALRREGDDLLRRIQRALRHKRGMDEPTRLHLADAADSLRQTLAARLPRAGI
jgi:hypothetical protein